MLSERRKAQGGLLAAGVVLVSTLTILYQGSQRAPYGPGKAGQPVVIGENFPAGPKINLASTGK